MTTGTPINDSKYVSANLDISDSTLRKYCLQLERAGYIIHKNPKGQRGFFEQDIVALRKLMEFKNNTDMTLEQASNAVVAWSKGIAVTDVVTQESRYNVRYDVMANDLKSLREELEAYRNEDKEFKKELLHRMDQRDQALTLALRETLETKQLIATTLEKKKKWWKFWES